MRRLVTCVSQLPLAETHKLLTVQCISDTSCQQLVGDGSCYMACSGQVGIGHCGADCDIPSGAVVYLRTKE